MAAAMLDRLRDATRRQPDAMELTAGDARLQAAVAHSRKLVHRRALTAGVAGAVPLPGLDWAVDAALLTRLLPRINEEFGLSSAQIDRLDAKEKERIHKAVAMAGSIIIGRVVTRPLVLRFARMVGLRLTAAQAAKYVPVAGQIVSGALGYAALRFLAEQHIRDCVRVARAVPLLPAPAHTRRLALVQPVRTSAS